MLIRFIFSYLKNRAVESSNSRAFKKSIQLQVVKEPLLPGEAIHHLLLADAIGSGRVGIGRASFIRLIGFGLHRLGHLARLDLGHRLDGIVADALALGLETLGSDILLGIDDEGLALGIPVVWEFQATGLVERLPTAIMAVAFCGLAAALLICGVILDTVVKGNRRNWELQVMDLESRWRSS